MGSRRLHPPTCRRFVPARSAPGSAAGSPRTSAPPWHTTPSARPTATPPHGTAPPPASPARTGPTAPASSGRSPGPTIAAASPGPGAPAPPRRSPPGSTSAPRTSGSPPVRSARRCRSRPHPVACPRGRGPGRSGLPPGHSPAGATARSGRGPVSACTARRTTGPRLDPRGVSLRFAHSVRRRCRGPFLGLGPRLPGGCGPGGWYNAASSRNRQIIATRCRWQARASSTAAKPPSVTRINSRSGSQRRTCTTICRVQSIEVLCVGRWPEPSGQLRVVRMEGPDPLAPGHRHQDPQRDPLQAEALHDVLARRADGIAVAALGLDAATLAPLDGVIGGPDDRPVAGEDGDDQAEQDLAGGPAGPGIAVQDAVVVGEVPLLAEPHDPQDRTEGAVAGRQEGSNGQELGLDPDAVGGQWSEGGQDGYDLRWQIQGGRSPRTMARMSPSIVANDPLDLPADLAKVEVKKTGRFSMTRWEDRLV